MASLRSVFAVAVVSVTVASCSLVDLSGLTTGDLASVGEAGVDGSQADPEAGNGDAGDGGEAGTGCAGNRGPASVKIDGRYCIDATEVTNAQYAEFFAQQPTFPGPGVCAGRSLAPTNRWPYTAGNENKPVVYVDYCMAKAYCTWAGKRLCGAFGGGSVPQNAVDNADRSEWFHACSKGDDGQHRWSYGNTFDANACNIGGNGSKPTADVGTYAGCQGGFPGVFDMSGNVAEWEEACGPCADPSDPLCCQARGAGVNYGEPYNRCAHSGYFNNRFNYAQDFLGIRCCADVR